MSSQRIHFKVDLTILEGKFAEFEEIAKELIAGSLKEPGTLGYEWHLGQDRGQCRVLETYADTNAALAHINGAVVKELLPKLLGFCSIDACEVYGDPGPKVREMLQGLKPKIFPYWKGLGK